MIKMKQEYNTFNNSLTYKQRQWIGNLKFKYGKYFLKVMEELTYAGLPSSAMDYARSIEEERIQLVELKE